MVISIKGNNEIRWLTFMIKIKIKKKMTKTSILLLQNKQTNIRMLAEIFLFRIRFFQYLFRCIKF